MFEIVGGLELKCLLSTAFAAWRDFSVCWCGYTMAFAVFLRHAFDVFTENHIKILRSNMS